MGAYYNEFDPQAAAWLRELIKRGLIADGEVDERSILDVSPDDVRGFTQCHFFAGIGGWSYALRLAGWPDDRPVWTGSPPCQPFSAAGKQLGQSDERHLAPHFISLVGAASPPVLFGEQVASSAVFGKPAKPPKRGAASAPEWAWIDDLSDRLEAARYAVGASDIPAAGVGAPHIRQRTFFGAIRLADAYNHGQWEHREPMGSPEGEGKRKVGERERLWPDLANGSTVVRLADADRGKRQGVADGEGCKSNGQATGWQQGDREPERGGASVRLADTESAGSSHGREGSIQPVFATSGGVFSGADASDSFWSTADWLFCRDGKWRPVIASFIEVADGLSDRMVLCCDRSAEIEEGEVNGATGDTSGGEILPAVRGEDVEAEVLGETGGQVCISSQSLLRKGLHGGGNGKGDLQEHKSQQIKSGKDGGEFLQCLRKKGEAARPSQGRGPFQQYPIKLADIVPQLSREISLAKLHGRSFAAGELQSLRCAIISAGPVLHPSVQDEALWASLSEEDKSRIEMDFGNRFVRVNFFPLSKGEEARVMRLRGYGNAIVPVAAAEFIRTFCEVAGGMR